MTASTLSFAAGAPVAQAAFLRGIERRAAVLAELLCGDAGIGDAAVAAAMRAFRNVAAREPGGDWPTRFWGLLLAVPSLRKPAQGQYWPPALAAVAQLQPGLRAALLLRLVAELGEVEAGAALSVTPGTYQMALQRAWPRRPDGSADLALREALADATQQMLRQLPAARLVRLAQLREAAIQGRRHDRPGRRPKASTQPAARWRAPGLLVACALCIAAFVGSFFRWSSHSTDAMPQIHAVALPAAAAPAAVFDAQTGVLIHPDFAQLADPHTDALTRDLDFYAWYAAQVAARQGADGGPLLLPDAAAPPADVQGPGARAAH